MHIQKHLPLQNNSSLSKLIEFVNISVYVLLHIIWILTGLFPSLKSLVDLSHKIQIKLIEA